MQRASDYKRAKTTSAPRNIRTGESSSSVPLDVVVAVGLACAACRLSYPAPPRKKVGVGIVLMMLVEVVALLKDQLDDRDDIEVFKARKDEVVVLNAKAVGNAAN